MFLVTRMCSYIETLRSAAKHPSLQEVLPRPKTTHKLRHGENANVPSVPGLAHSGSKGLLFKDADRFYATDVLLCSRYLALFVDEYVHCEANCMRQLMRRKAEGVRIIEHPFEEDDPRRLPEMVVDMFAEWLDKIVPALDEEEAAKKPSGLFGRMSLKIGSIFSTDSK